MMTYDQIEAVLGDQMIERLQGVIRGALRRHEARELHQEALEELLVALLASVIATPGEGRLPRRRAIECADRLEEAVLAALEGLLCVGASRGGKVTMYS
jgi:hypothetical protein